jgi:hypothetical protein
MVPKTYEARVLDDGHLSLTDEVRHELDLKSGDRVEVTIRRSSRSATLDPENPLVKMIGMCQGDGKTDSALNHDRYLYKEDQP